MLGIGMTILSVSSLPGFRPFAAISMVSVELELSFSFLVLIVVVVVVAVLAVLAPEGKAETADRRNGATAQASFMCMFRICNSNDEEEIKMLFDIFDN